MESKSQAGQDQFVLYVTNYKRDGTFLEIGASDPVTINNTYILEKEYNWMGIMVEHNDVYATEYALVRPNSIAILKDATTIDYPTYLKWTTPSNVFNFDYLQIDLDVENRSTLTTLELLDETVFPSYTFAAVTFEHDIYRGDYFSTRSRSREIFEKNGYVRVFSDVRNDNNPFEDWYVHPSLVEMDRIQPLITDESLEYTLILSRLNNVENLKQVCSQQK